MQRTMMRSVRSRLRLKRIHKGSCLLDRHVETSEETRVKGRSGGPDWLEPDLCLLGPSPCSGPALGLGGDAGSSPRAVRDDYAGRIECVARQRVGQAGACCHRGYRSYGRAEARSCIRPSRQRTECDQETDGSVEEGQTSMKRKKFAEHNALLT